MHDESGDLVFPIVISGIIRIRKSQKDRQHNGQRKKNKRTNVLQSKRIYAQEKRTLKQPFMKSGVIDIIDTHREVLMY
jgi:hypothetical protein